MMTAARENLDPKIQSRSGLSTLHLSSSLSHHNARRPSRATSTLAKDATRLFSLSLTRAEASSSSKRDDGDDKRRPSKDDGYEKNKKKTHHENIRDLIPNFPVVINQRHRARAARDQRGHLWFVVSQERRDREIIIRHYCYVYYLLKYSY